jgi:hypothetical protein
MTKSLKIDGVECITKLVRDTLQVDAALTYEIDAVTFQVIMQPSNGDEVIIKKDDTRIFAGIIKSVELKDRDFGVWEVKANDYTDEMDRHLVVETYSAMTASAIFKDIAVKYCSGFTTNGVQNDSATVEYIAFKYKKPSECFKLLCSYVGWEWQPTYDKDLQFFSVDAFNKAAPLTLVKGGPFRFNKFKVDTSDLINRVYVTGGTMNSDAQTLQWKADGAATTWTLPWIPYDFDKNTGLKIAEVAVKVGIENTDTEADFDYLINQSDCYIRCCSQTSAPASGATMSLTAKQAIDVITTVDDIASQCAISLSQGGDGVYEYNLDDSTLFTIDAAEAAGNAYLKDHSNPTVSGEFESEIDGWECGQIVTINLPDRGVVGDFLIQKIAIYPATNVKLTYKVTFGGRLFGISSFLKSLVSAQQQKNASTELLKKFFYGEDIASVSDELVATYNNPKILVEESFESKISAGESLQFEAIGSMLNIIQTNSNALAVVELQTSYDGVTWNDAVTVIPNTDAVEVLYPGYVKVTTSDVIRVYNWKKAFDESDAICGFVTACEEDNYFVMPNMTIK